jgi:radical SAM superfamily enzyme YgiQ (UPF0313 family)
MRMRRVPKLLLINPVNSVNIFSYLNPKNAKTNGVALVPPIGLGYIAALTPEDWDVVIKDESIAPFEYEEADLVGITATTGQAPRAYEISGLYKREGIPVIMGGIHASLQMEEASRYVDCIVTGEAEEIWGEVLSDFSNGHLKPVYRGGPVDLKRNITPRRDLFSNRYRIASIMTSRGCPFNCDFCTVTIFNGSLLRHRPVEDVVEEFANIKQRMILFLDDNLIGYSQNDRAYVKELFAEIVRRKIKKRWVCQTSINSLNDESVLSMASKAGCIGFFVGLESVNEEVLARMEKKANLTTGIGRYEECIRTVHKHGMVIMGNFVLGYERGIDEIKADTYWMRRSSVDIVNFSILTPYPGTVLYDRLKRDGRITLEEYPRDWGLYDADHPVSQMDYLSLEDIYEGIQYRIDLLYSYPAILYRFIRTLVRTRRILPSLIALFTNVFWTRRKNLARLAILESLMKRRKTSQ